MKSMFARNAAFALLALSVFVDFTMQILSIAADAMLIGTALILLVTNKEEKK